MKIKWISYHDLKIRRNERSNDIIIYIYTHITLIQRRNRKKKGMTIKSKKIFIQFVFILLVEFAASLIVLTVFDNQLTVEF